MKIWYYPCYKVFFYAQNVPNFPPPGRLRPLNPPAWPDHFNHWIPVTWAEFIEEFEQGLKSGRCMQLRLACNAVITLWHVHDEQHQSYIILGMLLLLLLLLLEALLLMSAVMTTTPIRDRSCMRHQLRSNISGRASKRRRYCARAAHAQIAAGIALLRHSSVIINVDQWHPPPPTRHPLHPLSLTSCTHPAPARVP